MTALYSNTAHSNNIEVWVREAQGIGIDCETVNDDETTDHLEVTALSLEGGRREMTGYFIAQGFTPVGGWEEKAASGATPLEYKRAFTRDATL